MTVRQKFIIAAFVVPVVTFGLGTYFSWVNWLFIIIVPLLIVGFYDYFQQGHSIKRLYPVVGHMRYLFESIQKEIQQYFVETDLSGRPVSREFRALVYQRAKGALDTRPLGTIFEVNDDGYEWINHSLAPLDIVKEDPRVLFGSKDCTKPYSCSAFNISAMSYGALSKNAIMALNKGAQEGGFAHNTGEGGLTQYHLKHKGDLIWQVGTGYFGCRDQGGNFDDELFKEKSRLDSVKMIEIKLSQGAKPGHGGILPAAKLTKEISEIRGVPMGKDVVSPAAHSTFSTPKGLLEFVKRLRDLSGGKPVGFKLCIGNKSEFLGICKAMIETGIKPDFITVDGGEGGTGAAPIEMTNSVGTPLRDGLIFVNSALFGAGVRDEIKIIASGKVFSAFHLLRLIALGADTVNSARGMMFALGCIHSRSCNTDECPTGIATQDPYRNAALVVNKKSTRVANFHRATVANLCELLAAAGLEHMEDLQPEHIQRRVHGTVVKSYAQLYPHINDDSLLNEDTVPADWVDDWNKAHSEQW